MKFSRLVPSPFLSTTVNSLFPVTQRRRNHAEDVQRTVPARLGKERFGYEALISVPDRYLTVDLKAGPVDPKSWVMNSVARSGAGKRERKGEDRARSTSERPRKR